MRSLKSNSPNKEVSLLRLLSRTLTTSLELQILQDHSFDYHKHKPLYNPSHLEYTIVALRGNHITVPGRLLREPFYRKDP